MCCYVIASLQDSVRDSCFQIGVLLFFFFLSLSHLLLFLLLLYVYKLLLLEGFDFFGM